ncbi:hypothetical protein HWQ46_26395 [Shewanella sp. D64]|uniref:hypothetical protein n=1 Tax=unclassified Shewanella TaxID=196818 RepID=UPI0022BA2970|nr:MULTISPECIES: hypothetical protein [unclassified Shewanella]MEC4729047.1 hypothetical protein [Shewanella sp. D64]MEC4737894.1 hypothetical protein [Shewanella sp. E94]WBJ93853.1 hypothetical protein HWQ47_18230 [Shewanella sp. MTB7]
MKGILLVLVLSLFSSSGYAWDGYVTGKIVTVDVAGGANYAFRVTLEGSPKVCNNNHAWAYLNASNSNYQTYVAVLLAAKMSGSAVTIYSNQEQSSGNGYCRIGYISLR